MSVHGPSRHFAASHQSSRFRCRADSRAKRDRQKAAAVCRMACRAQKSFRNEKPTVPGSDSERERKAPAASVADM